MSPAKDAVCQVSSEKGTWDLSGLSVDGEDFLYTTPDAVDFHVHLCAPVHAEMWNPLPAGTSPDAVTMYVKTGSGDRSIGSMQYNLSVSNTIPPAPVMTVQGPACTASPGQMTETTIRFICSPSFVGEGEQGPVLISHYPSSGAVDAACQYTFEWATPYACPTSGSQHGILGDLGAIAVFIGFLVVLALAWLVGKLLYNRFILKLSGRDVLPSLPSFSCPSMPALPSFFQRSSARKPWTSFRSSSYSRISSTADEEDGLVGRFGLDSDDEDDDEGEADAHPLEGDSRVWRSDGAGAGGATGTGKGGSGLISL